MHPPKHLIPFLVILFFLASCKKTETGSSSSPPPGNTGKPAVTTVGTPIGDPVTKQIDATGGSLVSSDGFLELIIPAGALSTATNISIQMVTPEMPGSISPGYDCLPSGANFNKPVKLVYHYGVEVASGNLYSLLFAYQDSAREWDANIKSRELDTLKKTFSTETLHFTTFAVGMSRKLTASPASVTSLQKSELVTGFFVDFDLSGSSFPVKVYIDRDIIVKKITDWKVNGVPGGNAADGFINSTQDGMIYTAPDHIIKGRKVLISAVVPMESNMKVQGEDITVHQIIESTEITLVPDEANFSVFIVVVDSAISNFYCGIACVPGSAKNYPIYFDTASFDLNIKNSNNMMVASITNLVNHAPGVHPASYVFKSEQFDWIADPNGEINITGLTLYQVPVIPSDSILLFGLKSEATELYGFTTHDPNGGGDYTAQPQPIPGIPGSVSIDITKDSVRTDDLIGIGAHLYQTVKVIK